MSREQGFSKEGNHDSIPLHFGIGNAALSHPFVEHAGQGTRLTLCSSGWFRSIAAVLGARLLDRERRLGRRLTTVHSEGLSAMAGRPHSLARRAEDPRRLQ